MCHRDEPRAEHWGRGHLSQRVDSVPVEMKRLDDLLDAHGFEQVDLVKMDIEGDDYRLFAGLDATTALRCEVVRTQVRDFMVKRRFVSRSAIKAPLHDNQIMMQPSLRDGDVQATSKLLRE